MFAFTSFGENIDSSTSDSHGPYIFKISGQIHHLMGSLLPTDNDSPKFAQLYIYDTKNEIYNRMSSYIFDDASKNLTESIIKILIKMLDQTNKLVKLFQIVKTTLKLRLMGQWQTDTKQYDLPTSNDIGALIVGDIGEYELGRDTLIENKTKVLQRISKLHPSYMSLQYPLLFPYGEDGYKVDLQLNTYSTNTKLSRNRISMRAFYYYQLQQCQNEGNTLLRSGRLFQLYIVDAYASVEEDKLDYIRKNKKNLRSDSWTKSRR